MGKSEKIVPWFPWWEKYKEEWEKEKWLFWWMMPFDGSLIEKGLKKKAKRWIFSANQNGYWLNIVKIKGEYFVRVISSGKWGYCENPFCYEVEDRYCDKMMDSCDIFWGFDLILYIPNDEDKPWGPLGRYWIVKNFKESEKWKMTFKSINPDVIEVRILKDGKGLFDYFSVGRFLEEQE